MQLTSFTLMLVHRWLPSSETLQNMKMCQKTNCRILHMFVIFAIGVKFVLHHKTHSFKSSTQYENENFLPWTPQNISTIFPLFNAIKIMKFFPVHFFWIRRRRGDESRIQSEYKDSNWRSNDLPPLTKQMKEKCYELNFLSFLFFFGISTVIISFKKNSLKERFCAQFHF